MTSTARPARCRPGREAAGPHRLRPIVPLILALGAAAGLAACAAGDPGRDAAGRDTMPGAAATTADTAAVLVADVGLETPESVLHDDRADVYLVSNINGAPLDRDGNGFISRVRPDGDVAELKWIDGEREGVTLHAPKGLALKGDTLFVADIDSVRAFDRTTGRPLGARGVPGATFLNDLAVGGDGTLYVTDSGLTATFEGSGTDAIHRFAPGGATAVARGAELANPNGIVAADGALIMVPFGSADVRRVPLRGGQPETIATLPGGQLDGVVRLDDGSLLVSSWEASAVFRVHTNGEGHAEPVVENVPSPADIGYDATRRRVLIPVFMENRLELRPVR